MKIKRNPTLAKAFLLIVFSLFSRMELGAQTATINTSLCGQAPAGTPCPGATLVQLYDFAYNITSGNPAFTGITGFTTSGTYQASDITGFTIYVTVFCAFNTSTPLQTIPAAGPGAHTFTFADPLPAAPAQRYFWITTNFTAAAVPGRTIRIDLITAPMTVFVGTETYGTNVQGGLQTICNPLPTQLISFTGRSDGNRNIIEWTTASESNNDFFTLEHSEDGIIFTTVTTVDGAGNSNMENHYSVIDDDRPSLVISYYRLGHTDHDGIFHYIGNIIAVDQQEEEEIYISMNTSGQQIIIGNISGATGYTIMNTMGQAVMQGMLDEQDHTIDITTIDHGMYILVLNDKNRTTKKFRKD